SQYRACRSGDRLAAVTCWPSSMACPASPSSTAMLTAWMATLVGPNSVPKSSRSSSSCPAILRAVSKVLVSLAALVIACGSDGQDQVQGAVERQHFRLGVRGDLRFQRLGGAGGDVVGPVGGDPGCVDLADLDHHRGGAAW